MNLKEAVAVAKQQVMVLLAADAPHHLRLEEYLYDDHLGVWSLTIGFDRNFAPNRAYKIVRISQSDKSVLSVKDR